MARDLPIGTSTAITCDPDRLRTISQWYLRDNWSTRKIIDQANRRWGIHITHDDIVESMRGITRGELPPDPVDEFSVAELRSRNDLVPHVRSLLVAAARKDPNGAAVAPMLRILVDLLPETREGNGLPQVGLDEVETLTDAELTRRWAGG